MTTYLMDDNDGYHLLRLLSQGIDHPSMVMLYILSKANEVSFFYTKVIEHVSYEDLNTSNRLCERQRAYFKIIK